MTGFVKARRGDAVVVGTRQSSFILGEQQTRHYEQYEVGIVTGITRDGHVRTWRPGWTQLDTRRDLPRSNRIGVWVLAAAEFDVEACLRTYRDHHWPGHDSGLPKPYESLDEVKAAMRPHRREEKP